MQKAISYSRYFMSLPAVLFIMYSSFGQSIDLQRDLVPEKQVKEAQKDFKNKTKKGIDHVTFNTDQLKEIVDRCDALGIDTIQFLICNLGKDEVSQYKTQYEKKHRAKKPNLKNMSASDVDLIGRQYLVIKIPSKAFEKTGASGKSAIPGAMASLLASGLIQVNPDGQKEGFIYLSIGRICPPPSDCEPATDIE